MTTNQKIKPDLPAEKLQNFLEYRVYLKDGVKITNIHAGFLWKVDNIERYRVNVWVKQDGREYISHSFFVHYDLASKEIVDYSIEQVSEKKRFFS